MQELSRPKNLNRFPAALFLIASIVIGGLAQSVAPRNGIDRAKLDQFFDRLNEKNKAMGSIVIAKDGKVQYSRSIGFSRVNANEKTPIGSTTKFPIGSITKTFTATMILQLVDEKKLKLTDSLDKYFPRVPNAAKITIADLLSHRSGIHTIGESPEYRALRDKGATTAEILSMIEKMGASDFEPGSKFVYTNENYFLLGLLIEKLTGKTYQENLRKRITSKVGLNDTYAASSAVDPARNESYSYRFGRDWEQETEIHWSLFFGSGGIVSTPFDMVKFIAALFDGKLVSKQGLALMTSMKDNYGFGIDTVKFGDKTYYGHTGGIRSYGAWLAYLPEEKLAMAYVTNAKPYPVQNIISGVFDIYWNRPFEIPKFDAWEVNPDLLDRYVGTYAIAGTPAKLTITRDGSALFVQFGGQSPIRLEATADDKFKIDPPGVFFDFDADRNQVTWKRGDAVRVFTKEK